MFQKRITFPVRGLDKFMTVQPDTAQLNCRSIHYSIVDRYWASIGKPSYNIIECLFVCKSKLF